MAANQWKKRPKDGQEPETPKWIATIDTATPSKAAVLGAALSGANPKNLALTLAAAASIAEAGLDRADEAIAVAVFVALGSVTVAGAVLVYLRRRQARSQDGWGVVRLIARSAHSQRETASRLRVVRERGELQRVADTPTRRPGALGEIARSRRAAATPQDQRVLSDSPRKLSSARTAPCASSASSSARRRARASRARPLNANQALHVPATDAVHHDGRLQSYSGPSSSATASPSSDPIDRPRPLAGAGGSPQDCCFPCKAGVAP